MANVATHHPHEKKDRVAANWPVKGKKDHIHLKYGSGPDQLWLNPEAAERIVAELQRALSEKPE